MKNKNCSYCAFYNKKCTRKVCIIENNEFVSVNGLLIKRINSNTKNILFCDIEKTECPCKNLLIYGICKKNYFKAGGI